MANKTLFWSFYGSFCTFCVSLRLTVTVFHRPIEILCDLRGYKSEKICVNLWLINVLRLRIPTYEIIKLFLQNETKFQKSQMNLNNVLTKNYEQMDTWSIGKNEPKTNPNEPKFKMGKINITTCLTINYEQRTINDEKSEPKRTQTNPISVLKMLNCAIYNTNNSTGQLTPQEIAFSTACELVKITGHGDASGANYMTTSCNNWKAENL